MLALANADLCPVYDFKNAAVVVLSNEYSAGFVGAISKQMTAALNQDLLVGSVLANSFQMTRNAYFSETIRDCTLLNRRRKYRANFEEQSN